MSMSPRSRPPGPLSTRNQSGRSERADGGMRREPSRGAHDTPASAAARNNVQQVDQGQYQSGLMNGINASTPPDLPAPGAPDSGLGGDPTQGQSSVMTLPAPPLSTASQMMKTSRPAAQPWASGGRTVTR